MGSLAPRVKFEGRKRELTQKGSFHNVSHQRGLVHISSSLHEVEGNAGFIVGVILVHVGRNYVIDHYGHLWHIR